MTSSITRNLSGAFDLLLNREQGLEKLDLSADGFWESFKGLALAGVIDLIALMIIFNTRSSGAENAGQSAFTFALTALAIALTSYLVAMLALFFLCQYSYCADRYSTAFIANNWASPIVSLGYLPVVMLISTLSTDASAQNGNPTGMLILLPVFAILVIVGIRLLRISLNVTLGKAIMLFCGSTFVSLLIDDALRSLFNA